MSAERPGAETFVLGGQVLGIVRPIACLFLLAAACAIGYGQARPTLTASRASTPPVIDGAVNDAEWSAATPFEGLYDRETGSPAESGKFWILFDDQYIYFAARLADASPASIRAIEYRTNIGLSGDDNVALWLEPTGSLESFNIFAMNPAGGSNLEIAGGRAIKREWLGEFLCKGRITESGWEAEARIPWKLMQLPAPGKRTAKFNVSRYMPRTQRESIHAFVGGAGINYGWLTGLEIPKLPFERSLKLLPYGLAGHEEGRDPLFEAGLDVKTSLTEQIEFVGTVNPDFRNVEGDILSLDFSYLERLPQDNRPFFQEGANYVGSILFAPQRIGEFDTGFNVYGRLSDKITFGALGTFDFGKENAAVATATYQIDPQHLFRVSGSTLKGDLRPDNDALLLRYVERFRDWGYGLRYSQSDDEALGNGRAWDMEAGFSRKGWFGQATYADVEANYFPRLGFIPERDYKGYSFEGGKQTLIQKGPVMEYEVFTSYLRYDRQNGDFYREDAGLIGSMTMRDGLDLDVGVFKNRFEQNRDTIYFVSMEKPRGDRYRRLQIDHQWGEIAGEDYRNTTVRLMYRPLPRMQAGFIHQMVDHFDRIEQTILTASYDLGKDQSVSGRVVRRDGDVGGYVSWRRSGNKGTEYYVIVGDPNAPKFRSSLILKVVMPFELKL